MGIDPGVANTGFGVVRVAGAQMTAVDGGVIEVVPVRLARELAGDEGAVLAIDCNAGGKWPAADSFVAIAGRPPGLGDAELRRYTTPEHFVAVRTLPPLGPEGLAAAGHALALWN